MQTFGTYSNCLFVSVSTRSWRQHASGLGWMQLYPRSGCVETTLETCRVVGFQCIIRLGCISWGCCAPVRHGAVRCGRVCIGVVSCAVVWCGVGWCGLGWGGSAVVICLFFGRPPVPLGDPPLLLLLLLLLLSLAIGRFFGGIPCPLLTLGPGTKLQSYAAALGLAHG